MNKQTDRQTDKQSCDG